MPFYITAPLDIIFERFLGPVSKDIIIAFSPTKRGFILLQCVPIVDTMSIYWGAVVLSLQNVFFSESLKRRSRTFYIAYQVRFYRLTRRFRENCLIDDPPSPHPPFFDIVPARVLEALYRTFQRCLVQQTEKPKHTFLRDTLFVHERSIIMKIYNTELDKRRKLNLCEITGTNL